VNKRSGGDISQTGVSKQLRPAIGVGDSVLGKVDMAGEPRLHRISQSLIQPCSRQLHRRRHKPGGYSALTNRQLSAGRNDPSQFPNSGQLIRKMVDRTTAPHEVECIVLERQLLDRRFMKSNAFAGRVVGESGPVVLKQVFACIGGVDTITIANRLRQKLSEPRRPATGVKNPTTSARRQPIDNLAIRRLVKPVRPSKSFLGARPESRRIRLVIVAAVLRVLMRNGRFPPVVVT
jgi:hypothetical protein